jgi:hypothetical protein
VLVATDYFTK